MSDSSQPVSKPGDNSYVVLCRELALTREFQYGDEYELWDKFDYPNRQGWIAIYGTGCNSCGSDDEPKESDPWHVWLPSLSDWLEILEIAGKPLVSIEPVGDRWEMVGWNAQSTESTSEWGGRGYPSREEAAARLWMVVTQLAGK